MERLRQNAQGTNVRTSVPFLEEKFLFPAKAKRLPEASNMLRQALFRRLDRKLQAVSATMPRASDHDLDFTSGDS